MRWTDNVTEERRAHYWTCGRKVRYPKLRMLLKALDRIQREGIDADMTPYHCRVCGGWHMGHTKHRKGFRDGYSR